MHLFFSLILTVISAGCLMPWAQVDGPVECPVHRLELEVRIVPIRYGRLAMAPAEARALFPFARDSVSGGCMNPLILDSIPQYGFARTCPDCEAAKKKLWQW